MTRIQNLPLKKSVIAFAGVASLLGPIASAEAQEVAALSPPEPVELASSDFLLKPVPAPDFSENSSSYRLPILPEEQGVGASTRDTLEQRAFERRIARRELIFQALNVADAVQTISCLKRDTCTEMNPLLGSDPSIGTVIAFKAGFGGAHLLVTKLLQKHALGQVGNWQVTSIAVQGGVVAWNLRQVF